MYDRESLYPGRIQLKDLETGDVKKYDLTMADMATQEGTPPTKANLLSDEVASIFGLEKSGTVNDALRRSVPIGTVLWSAKNTAPAGFLICDGSAISRTEYEELFSEIGTTFGAGDGSSTFNIPDLRAAFIRGSGSQNGYSASFGTKNEGTSIYTGGFGNGLGTLSANYADKTSTVSSRTFEESRLAESVNSITVRPFNVALTPIIKY